MEEPQVRGPSPDPDLTEAEPGAELDNIASTRGHQGPHVVDIGGSAGSIEALQQFFSAMPADPGLAFVIV
ncbi:MAG TPA: hypothetical protein VNG33_08720, partial [Polyangiaceae bacterium]|nr:hypothetical protein [Polyangiaceae bacterium]